MRPRRIAICTAQVPFVYGGNERLVASLHAEIVKRGMRAEVISIPFKWYPSSRLVTECMIWRMLDITESNGERIDAVIATKFPSTVVKHPNKRIWLVHQHRAIYDLYGTAIGDFGYQKEDVLVRDAIVNIDNRTISEAKKVCTISRNVSGRLKRFNGIESEPLYPPPANMEKFHNEGYGDYVLYMGRLNKAKRVDMLIDSFRFARAGSRCLIAGAGEERGALEGRVRELGLGDRVKLLGFVTDDEAIRLYANARAVFYAPYDEDYGFTTVEAFLSRKPVITTEDSGGVLEFVEDGESGFVTKNDPREIADRIDRLFASRDECARLGERGYELVKGIGWDNVIEGLLE
ncbi:MAG: hypothetical protein A2X93_07985 [Deltaproteobacteria bacterium GWC2_56_8]|nr:MAG: hypothetical protein A2X99_06055 [Deltaproteobacteria bacterium GWB2_55_19]OGP37203.1 MAG: hypothetical protein A2X93_07985 [Deltaproteobacteria bacterium GWC2_56_8]HAO92534.1 hypothetical protein [Deltaproteobacteria bacterium]